MESSAPPPPPPPAAAAAASSSSQYALSRSMISKLMFSFPVRVIRILDALSC